MALASVDVIRISVVRSPRVFILPTGRELYEAGQIGPAGGIANSSMPFPFSRLRAAGAEVTGAPLLADDPSAFRAFLAKIKSDPPDVLITTGAVSMGCADFVRAGLEHAGAQILFHGVDIRPGKPILFARFGEDVAARPFVVCGLPGNPVSTAVGSSFLLSPIYD